VGALNSAHIHGTEVPVEQRSTALNSEVELADADFRSTPQSIHPARELACPKGVKPGSRGAKEKAVRRRLSTQTW